MNRKKEMIIALVGIFVLIFLMFGVTYAVFTYTKFGSTENIITTGALRFLYTEDSTGISITNAKPVADSVGMAYTSDETVFDFKLEGTNTSDEIFYYKITLEKDSSSTLDESAVKVYLTDVDSGDTKLKGPNLYKDLDEYNEVDNVREAFLYQGSVTGEYSKNFRLRMWVSDSIDFKSGNYDSQTFASMVNVYFDTVEFKEKSLYTESLLNGTDPVLKDSLIPVIITDSGVVTKANIYEEWYDYETKKWANAVILKNENTTYNNGDVIPESNIESYFVWIPKYSYQLWDLGNYTSLTGITKKERVISVRFGLTNTSDSVSGECTTPGTAGASGSCGVGEYMTHPAFTSFNSNGFWVGKFETGYDGATSTEGAQSDTVNTSKIIIKPNVYSWRNIKIGNMFKNSYDYNRSLDSHMMKNTEWGAVAYLQHSAYGSATSVRINNNSASITGYASTVEPTLGGGTNSIEGSRIESTALGVDGTYTVNYLNTSSVVASTTGNYSGVYDMSGGTWEYVMGYTTGASTTGGSSEITSLYSNFFTNSTYTKYWDKYTSTALNNFNNRILGDATGEMGTFGQQVDPDSRSRWKSSWYGDYAYLVYSDQPWFYRGGFWGNGTSAGAFSFYTHNGSVQTIIGYRITLTPTK